MLLTLVVEPNSCSLCLIHPSVVIDQSSIFEWHRCIVALYCIVLNEDLYTTRIIYLSVWLFSRLLKCRCYIHVVSTDCRNCC